MIQISNVIEKYVFDRRVDNLEVSDKALLGE